MILALCGNSVILNSLPALYASHVVLEPIISSQGDLVDFWCAGPSKPSFYDGLERKA